MARCGQCGVRGAAAAPVGRVAQHEANVVEHRGARLLELAAEARAAGRAGALGERQVAQASVAVATCGVDAVVVGATARIERVAARVAGKTAVRRRGLAIADDGREWKTHVYSAPQYLPYPALP